MDWYLKVLKNYLGFGGRATQRVLDVYSGQYHLYLCVGPAGRHAWLATRRGEGVLTTIYGVLIFLPWWAVQFRRLHDTDRSAWWLLLLLIPIIGWLIIIAFNCQNGTPGDNRFGPDPKRFS